MDFVLTTLEGCFELIPKVQKDLRGHFVKIFQSTLFADRGLATDFKEDYYSYSHRDVLRGMHFQNPPHAHEKIVYCVVGEVVDVILDLRPNSKTYGKTCAINLSAQKGNAVYISQGLAHGFFVLSEQACMMYKVTTEYSPQHDEGIHWRSIPFHWPTKTPIVSDRDSRFIDLSRFVSPF